MASARALQDLLHNRIQRNTQAERNHAAGRPWVAAVGRALAMLLGIAITRSVTKPLGHAVDAANAVAEGNLDFAIERRWQATKRHSC